jgi:aspartyl protease family protein
MGRAYLIIIVAAGAFASMLNNAPSPESRAATEHRFRDAVPRDESDQDDSRQAAAAVEGTVELERNFDGHFYADVEINGTPVRALVDTGATGIALSREDARSAGLAVSIGMPGVVGRGADGDVRGEYVTLDRVTLGHRSAERMDAVVLNAGEQTLLGQDFLSKFESVEIKGDKMLLR